MTTIMEYKASCNAYFLRESFIKQIMKALKHIQYEMQMYCTCIMMFGSRKWDIHTVVLMQCSELPQQGIECHLAQAQWV